MLMQGHVCQTQRNRTDRRWERRCSCSATNMDSLCDEYCVVAQIQEEVKTQEDCIDQIWVKSLKHLSDWCSHIKKLVSFAFSIPVSNAYRERVFSLITQVWTNEVGGSCQSRNASDSELQNDLWTVYWLSEEKKNLTFCMLQMWDTHKVRKKWNYILSMLGHLD